MKPISDLELLNASEENLIWFQNNSAKIQEEFSGEIIAIKDKSIIGNKSNFGELRNTLKLKGINEDEVLIQMIPKVGEIVIL